LIGADSALSEKKDGQEQAEDEELSQKLRTAVAY